MVLRVLQFSGEVDDKGCPMNGSTSELSSMMQASTECPLSSMDFRNYKQVLELVCTLGPWLRPQVSLWIQLSTITSTRGYIDTPHSR